MSVATGGRTESGFGSAATVAGGGTVAVVLVQWGVDPVIAIPIAGFVGFLLGTLAQYARDQRSLGKDTLLWRLLAALG